MPSKNEQITRVYSRITAIMFDRLSPTFGTRTIAAIAKNVIARQTKTHRELSYLTASEKGFDWTAFVEHVEEVSDEELSAGLEAFLDEFFDALSKLIGRLIMGQLLKEAEQMAQTGGDNATS